MINREAIEKILGDIPDPEIGVSIFDLGLIYDITIDDETGVVSIRMTLTSLGCPLFPQIESAIRDGMKQIPEVKRLDIDLTFDPPWSPDKMTEEAKVQLGF